MYSTCMFCHTSLGSNEAIEHFPVGRRLAFDAARGRLWVVCKACERWNLSPLEERWEAIEECEKLFRDTKLRVSTDNIGLARLKEGTTLVRVGDPQRPEMAAWRYGDQFHRRRKKYFMWAGAGTAAAVGLVVAGPVMGLIGGASINLINIPNLILSQRTVARVPLNGTVLRLNRKMLMNLHLEPDETHGFALTFPHKPVVRAQSFRMAPQATVELQGDEALSAARHLLPALNRTGGRAADVAKAVAVLETASDPVALFERFASTERVRTDRGNMSAMSTPVRLALEMSLHEEDERRALEGELAELEERWREAEEIATISDDMFVPSGVDAMLKRLKGGPK
ncbi:MAG: hypothetical protein ACREN6_06700 [Gemmatimonadaceae bacterium]